MKTVYIDPRVSRDQFELFDGQRSREQVLEAISSVERDVTANPLGKRFESRFLTDDDGSSYGRLRFIVQSAYELDGQLWITGIQFTVNITLYFEELREIVEEAYAGPIVE